MNREEVYITLHRDDWRVDRSKGNCPPAAEVNVVSVPSGTSDDEILGMWESHQAEIVYGSKIHDAKGVTYLPELSVGSVMADAGVFPLEEGVEQSTSGKDMEYGIGITKGELTLVVVDPASGNVVTRALGTVESIVDRDALDDLLWEVDRDINGVVEE